ncbi:MAG: formate/nitrite transporter family protein, partial [Thaumarchaeota archaeon]
MDFAKEIGESIGLEFLYNEDHIRNKGLEFSSLENRSETPSVTPSANSSDSLQPSEIAEKMEKVGVQKVNLNSFSAFILAITAGAFIALGGIYFTFATSQIIVTRPFTQIIGGMVFSMGLILVVIAGAELFTGNHLAIMGLASRKITVSKLLRNWILVYVGNFLGSVATAAILYMSKAWTNNGYQFGIRAMMIASHKVSLGFVEAFFLGILCNSLVCLALWLAASGKKVSDKVLAIIFPISAFVAIGFEHSVANMYFLTFSLMIKDDPMLLSAMKTAGIAVDTSNIDYIGVLNNLVPVTLGNIVGGCLFVGLVYWLAYL